MADYAIGDVQGCYKELMQLLELVAFNPEHDTLWFVGDLVNRGPDSLAVLRFVSNLPHVHCVLGNHDLHLLALAYGVICQKHTLQEVLTAPDRDILLHWLRQQRLLYFDEHYQIAFVHAGIPPQWSLTQALQHAREVERLLLSKQCGTLLANMYGKQPAKWNDRLCGWSRYRYIMNAFTRMRYCSKDGALELTTTEAPGAQPVELIPWYQLPQRKTVETRIVFGHWAALMGGCNTDTLQSIDTGCVWGNCLTALRLSDFQRFSVGCQKAE